MGRGNRAGPPARDGNGPRNEGDQFGGKSGFGNGSGGELDSATWRGAGPRNTGQKFDGQDMARIRAPSRQPTPDANGAQQVTDVTGDRGDPTGDNRSWETGSASMKVGQPPKMSIGGSSNNTKNIQSRATGGNSTATKQVPYQERIKGCID